MMADHKNERDAKPRVNAHIDHTILKATTTWEEVKQICDEAMKHNFVAVCIPACYVKEAKAYMTGSEVKVATVIGFPLGHMTKEAKIYETT